MSVLKRLLGGRPRALVARTAAWMLSAASAGCTVNGRPLLGPDPRRYFENDAHTGRSVMIDAWGINLSTVHGDAGLTLGRTRRTYYFPGPASGRAPAGPRAHASGAARDLRLATTRPFDLAPTGPLALRGHSDGLSLTAGMTGFHLTAGLRAFEALCLPPGGNAYLLLRTRTTRPADDVFHVTETRP